MRFATQIYHFFLNLLLVGLPFLSSAQYKPHPLLGSMWQLEAEHSPTSQILDTTLQNGFSSLNYGMRFPLWKGKDWLDANGGKPFCALLFACNVKAQNVNGNFIDPSPLLTNPTVTITPLMAKGLRNLYLAQASAALPTTSLYFNPTYIRFHGSLIWRHLYLNNKWWHTLGISYSPIYGKDLPLPVAGIGYKIDQHQLIQFTYPYHLAYTNAFSKNFSLTAKISQHGGYNFLNKDSLHEKTTYRYQFRRAGLQLRYYTDRFVVLNVEAGVTDRWKLEFYDSKSIQRSTFYLKASIQVRFGARPSVAPILNFDPGDSGFDPNYIVEN